MKTFYRAVGCKMASNLPKIHDKRARRDIFLSPLRPFHFLTKRSDAGFDYDGSSIDRPRAILQSPRSCAI